MTPKEDVFKTLSAVGIPGTWVAWRHGSVKPLPWFVFSRESGGEVMADNSNYACLPRFRVELMLAESDPELQARFEEALGSIGPFTSNEGWIPGENAYQIAYSITWHPHRENQ